MRTESRIEAWIEPAEASPALEAELSRIGPFGTLNLAPLLGMRGLTLRDDPSKFGKTTVNWNLHFAETPVPAVVFGRPSLPFGAGDLVDIVFHFVQDSYNGLQFLVRDMRLAAAP